MSKLNNYFPNLPKRTLAEALSLSSSPTIMKFFTLDIVALPSKFSTYEPTSADHFGDLFLKANTLFLLLSEDFSCFYY